jgi:hypothetical protein
MSDKAYSRGPLSDLAITLGSLIGIACIPYVSWLNSLLVTAGKLGFFAEEGQIWRIF